MFQKMKQSEKEKPVRIEYIYRGERSLVDAKGGLTRAFWGA